MVGTRVYSHNGQRLYTARLSKDSERMYAPLFPPCVDNDELAAEGERVILYHGNDGPEIRTTPRGVLAAGWAIGLLKD